MTTIAERLRAIANAMPDDGAVTLQMPTVRAWLADESAPQANVAPSTSASAVESWRAKLWTVDPSTRLGVREIAEAVGRPRSWVYRHTAKSAGAARIPHRKLDGEVIAVAGELRAWLEQHEEIISRAPRALRSA